jgi:multidrug efflux system outer membrane protein
VATLARERAQARDALTLLVGAPIGPSPEPTPLAGVGLVLDVPEGLPSELLLQRPDVRAAEQQIIAANFDIGSARAAFFPRISLTASGGSASSALSGLFGAGAGVWSFIPALVQPLLQIPQNIAQLKVAKVDKDIAVAQYEKTIQAAFRDVSDALVARAPLDDQVRSLQQQRDAEARRLELAEQRYAGGVSSFLEVLDAQRSLLEAERALVQARQLRLSNAVDLYTALGGGLHERTGDEAARPGVPAKAARRRS